MTLALPTGHSPFIYAFSADEADGYGASAVGVLPLGRRVKLFARYGVFWWETRETFDENCLISTDENSGNDAVYAAGIEFDPGKRDDFVIRAEASRHEVDDDGNEIDSNSGGILFRF